MDGAEDTIVLLPEWTDEDTAERKESTLEEEETADRSLAPVPTMSDFTSQVNELQAVHEREQRTLEELKQEHLQERRKQEEVVSALLSVSQVRAGLEAEIANSQKELQDLNAAAYSSKQDLMRLLFEIEDFKRKLAEKMLSYNRESELLEGEAECVVGFSEQVSGYFAQERETALTDKRAQLAGLTSQVQELEVEDKKLKEGEDNQGVIIEDLQQKVQLLSLQEQRLEEQLFKTQDLRRALTIQLDEAKERRENIRGMIQEDIAATAARNSELSLEVSEKEEQLIALNRRITDSEKQLADKREGAVRKRRELFSVSL